MLSIIVPKMLSITKTKQKEAFVVEDKKMSQLLNSAAAWLFSQLHQEEARRVSR